MARPPIQYGLDGLKETLKSLEQFSEATARNITSQSLAEAAEPMAQAARNNAPVDTGELREAIGVSTRVDVKYTQRLRNKNFRFAYVGPSYSKFEPNYAPHAHLVEFGTSARYHKNGKYVGQAPAQPFLRPAFDAYKEVVVTRFRDVVAVKVAQAAARAERKAKRLAGGSKR